MRATGGQAGTGRRPQGWLGAAAALAALAGLALAPATPALARPASSASASPASDSATAGNVLIVISEQSQKVTFIGPSWRVTRSLGDPDAAPDSIAVSPDGKFAIIAEAACQANELIVFGGADSPDPKMTGRIDLGDSSYPGAAAITPNDEYAYVPGAGDPEDGGYTVGVISGVNADDPELSDSLQLNPSTDIDASIPCGIAISPDGKYAYATDYSFGTLTVITAAQDGHPKLAKPVPAGESACEDQTVVAPDGQYAYIADGSAGKVSVIGDAQGSHPADRTAISAPGSAELSGVAPIAVGIYSDFTPEKGKHPYARVTKALDDEHWPLIGNVAALAGRPPRTSPRSRPGARLTTRSSSSARASALPRLTPDSQVGGPH